MDKATEKLALLDESKAKEREGKFLVMGARREGGTLAPVMFCPDQGTADAGGAALASTGWANVEVYTRVSAHTRK